MLCVVPVLIVIFGIASPSRTHAAELQTVEHVDLDRYVGKWYELARFPNRFERQCHRNVTAESELLMDLGSYTFTAGIYLHPDHRTTGGEGL